jgi:hypothetical protein
MHAVFYGQKDQCKLVRKFALVLVYEYDSQEFKFLRSYTSSQALKLNASGVKDLLHILLAILSWKTVVDVGLPPWCNDSRLSR